MTNLQADSDFAIGKAHKHVRHMSIAGRCNETPSELVTGCSVKPRSNCVDFS